MAMVAAALPVAVMALLMIASGGSQKALQGTNYPWNLRIG
jgi:hypothetical protein